MISNVSIKISEAAVQAVVDVLRSGYLVQGPKVKQFEEEFARFCGVEHAVAVSNGTTGLHLALLALGVERGDEVITTPFTFIASGTSILFVDAKPVFADIDPRTFNIDPDRIEEAITERTKAIMPIHLYGQSAEMDRIMKIARDHDLAVLEDACQSHGGELNGKKVGSLGDAGVFSFYPTKNMTTGEGGMITTNDEKVAETLRLLRNHGQESRYSHVLRGFNFRLTDIGAAIGIEELKLLDGRTERRRANAKYLSEQLGDVVEVPYVTPGVRHVFHQYTIKTDRREELISSLTDHQVGYGIYYPKPLYAFKPFENCGAEKLPVTEDMIKKVISLPVHQDLSREDLDTIVKAVRAVH